MRIQHECEKCGRPFCGKAIMHDPLRGGAISDDPLIVTLICRRIQEIKHGLTWWKWCHCDD
jgi:hypothetical protein